MRDQLQQEMQAQKDAVRREKEARESAERQRDIAVCFSVLAASAAIILLILLWRRKDPPSRNTSPPNDTPFISNGTNGHLTFTGTKPPSVTDLASVDKVLIDGNSFCCRNGKFRLQPLLTLCHALASDGKSFECLFGRNSYEMAQKAGKEQSRIYTRLLQKHSSSFKQKSDVRYRLEQHSVRFGIPILSAWSYFTQAVKGYAGKHTVGVSALGIEVPINEDLESALEDLEALFKERTLSKSEYQEWSPSATRADSESAASGLPQPGANLVA